MANTRGLVARERWFWGKVTAREVADALGVHRVTVSEWENGRRRIPRPILRKWAAAVGMAFKDAEALFALARRANGNG